MKTYFKVLWYLTFGYWSETAIYIKVGLLVIAGMFFLVGSIISAFLIGLFTILLEQKLHVPIEISWLMAIAMSYFTYWLLTNFIAAWIYQKKYPLLFKIK